MKDNMTIIRGYREAIMEDREYVEALTSLRHHITKDDRLDEDEMYELVEVINDIIDAKWESFSS
jgi:hypothetical protein